MFKEYTFLWFIENYSYCWHKNTESLDSPKFTADGLDGSVFYLRLYPRGRKEEDKGYISIFLRRSEVDDGPVVIPLFCKISFLTTDGSSIFTEIFTKPFLKKTGHGFPQCVETCVVLSIRNAEFLPQDTLSLRCKIWKGEGPFNPVDIGNSQPVIQIKARTCIKIENLSFLHVLEDFSALLPNEKRAIQIQPPSQEQYVISNNVCFTDGSCCEEKIMVEIATSCPYQILSKCKISLLDSSGNVIECGEADNRSDATRKDIHKLPLSLTREVILNKKSEYLPDDKLSLSFECFFSSGLEYEKVERVLYEKPFVTLNQISNTKQDDGISAENMSGCPSALDELKEIYSNQFLTDVALKTKTKSFPAHKLLLCARSPVFKAMMLNDMKEKHSNFIQVDDLEDETVHQLLLFLYSDSLENLLWESAIKLYYAADKYDIRKLKNICSAFVIHNVTTSSVIELLLLADKHNDCYLKKAAEDYIFKHENKVYGLGEWENLIELNPTLVSKTMLSLHKRKK